MKKEKYLQPKSIAIKTLSRINEEHISPRPKWQFWLTEKAFWLSFGASVLIGAAAVAATIYTVQNTGWKFYLATEDNFATLFFTSLPYLWMSAMGIFTAFAYFTLRHTRHGYRYSLMLILLSSIIASTILGALFYRMGFGEFVDEEIGEQIPFHRSTMTQEHGRWSQPGRGALGGEVGDINDQGNFTLHAFDGRDWLIDTSELPVEDREVFHNFSQVRIIGIPFAGSTTEKFHACFIFGWEVAGKSPWLSSRLGTATRTERATYHVSERNISELRTNECKGVRPYDLLQKIRNRR